MKLGNRRASRYPRERAEGRKKASKLYGIDTVYVESSTYQVKAVPGIHP